MTIEIPGYEIIGELGKGGMANVYRARQVSLEREVALKVMSESLNSDPTFGERFLREARIVAQLNHPNIIQIYDVNQHEGMNYLTMELVPGGELTTHLKMGIGLEVAVRVLVQMMQALDFAHHKGYIHRDIKPGNILFRDDGSAVLTDFGIARAKDSKTSMTVAGSIIGTPSYMSPEQAQGQEIDGRSDLYSLGVLFFEMITGDLPYKSDSHVNIAVKHITDPIPRLDPEFAYLQPFIDKVMAKSPDDRFDSGLQMAKAIIEITEGHFDDPVELGPYRGEAAHSTGGHTPKRLAPGTSSGGDYLSGLKTSEMTMGQRASGVSSSAATVVKTPTTGGFATAGHDDPTVLQGTPAGMSRVQAPSSRGPLYVGLGLAAVLCLAIGIWLYQSNVEEVVPVINDPRITTFLAQGFVALNEQNLDKSADSFRKVLEIDKNNVSAMQGLAQIANEYPPKIEAALEGEDIVQAKLLLDQLAVLDSGYARLGPLRKRLALAEENSLAKKGLEEAQRVRIDQLLFRADEALAKGRLVVPDGSSAYDFYRQVIGLSANNLRAKTGMDAIATELLVQAINDIAKGSFTDAELKISQARRISPEFPQIATVHGRLQSARQEQERERGELERKEKERKAQIASLLSAAQSDLAQDRLRKPEDNNAVKKFSSVLTLDPMNEEAKQGLLDVAAAYITKARAAIGDNNFKSAEKLLQTAAEVAPRIGGLAQTQEQLADAKNAYEAEQKRQRLISQLLRDADNERSKGKLESSVAIYEQVLIEDSSNEKAQKGIQKVVAMYGERAKKAMDRAEFDLADKSLNAAQALRPQDPQLQRLVTRLPKAREEFARKQAEKMQAQKKKGVKIASLLKTASQDFDAKRYTSPVDKNALDKYQLVLILDKGNKEAAAGIKRIATHYILLTQQATKLGNLGQARDYLATLRRVDKQSKDIPQLTRVLDARLAQVEANRKREEALQNLISTVHRNIGDKLLPEADKAYLEAKKLDPSNPKIKALPSSLADAYYEQAQLRLEEQDYANALAAADKGLGHKAEHRQLAEVKSAALKAQQDLKAQEKKKRRSFPGF